MFRWFEKKIDPFPEKEIPVPSDSFFPFVWESTKGIRPYILSIGLLSVLIGAFEALLFVILGKVVDWLSAIEPAKLWDEEAGTLLLLAIVIIVSIIPVGLQTLIRFQAFSGNFTMRLRWQFHRLMLGQSISFFQDEFSGRIVTKVMQTAEALRGVYMIVVDILVFAVIYFITMVFSVGHFDRWLILPLGVWFAAYMATLCWIVPRLAKASQNLADGRSLMVGRVTDAYTNIATVKLFSHAGREAEYARSAMREFLAAVYALMRKISAFEIINHLLAMSLIVGSSAMAIRLWMLGEVGVGALAAIGAMSLRLNGMSHWIMWESSQLFEHVGTIHDGINTLSKTRKVIDQPDAVSLRVTRGDIRFTNICFDYEDENEHSGPVIDTFNLHIRPGEKIGIVGRSGAGKSTLVGLLLRFHDIQKGSILIDDQDISAVTQDSLRSQIGLVMQDTSLMHRSVRDNIVYGHPEATDAEVNAVANRAKAYTFISGLMDSAGRKGFDAHVGERGVKLSGGQRQRIAIARVMLKNAPILVLDEATSALDSEVETAIQENLYRLMEGKTVMAIAHRLSTIAAMDRLIVMDNGRIVEQGTHADLLVANGIYAKLWDLQSGGFLGDDELA